MSPGIHLGAVGFFIFQEEESSIESVAVLVFELSLDNKSSDFDELACSSFPFLTIERGFNCLSLFFF